MPLNSQSMMRDVSELDITTYPEPVLRERAVAIPAVNDDVRAVAQRMIEVMHRLEGIGLAAPQIGLSWRMFVAHVHEDEEDGRFADTDPPSATLQPEVYINPVLSDFSPEREPFSEGCLSLPKIRGEVIRPTSVTITALDPHGNPFTRRATGLLARCWQHEMDHLDGVLIIDRMTQMSRLKNRQLVRELERRGNA
ncbi:MAG: peptide deformylase [Phycisphaerales bacterium]|nr:peptide deformylase [Phycisphaerales bacterium]